jgi:hypothetical protein
VSPSSIPTRSSGPSWRWGRRDTDELAILPEGTTYIPYDPNNPDHNPTALASMLMIDSRSAAAAAHKTAALACERPSRLLAEVAAHLQFSRSGGLNGSWRALPTPDAFGALLSTGGPRRVQARDYPRFALVVADTHNNEIVRRKDYRILASEALHEIRALGNRRWGFRP